MMANLRLVLDVEVQPGNQCHSTCSAPGLLGLLGRIPTSCRPAFVRGDCDWDSGPIMDDLDNIDQAFLFKVKKSPRVKELIYKHHCLGKWTRFKDGWEAKEDQLHCQAWSKSRRAILVRRQIQKDRTLLVEHKHSGQQTLALIEEPENMKLYEHSVLVTSLEGDLISIVQHYRDRADCENVFDEMKKQWGWGGYTTRDSKSCRFLARIIGLIYNWWSLFVRMTNSDGDQHHEAITSRPLLLTGVGRLTESGRQKTMTITSHHGQNEKVQALFQKLNQFFCDLKTIAPQLGYRECWSRILAKVIEKIVPINALGPPGLTPSTG